MYRRRRCTSSALVCDSIRIAAHLKRSISFVVEMEDLPQATTQLRVASPDGLDRRRKTKIANALHQFRQTVTQHNFNTIRIMVGGLTGKGGRIGPLSRNLGPLPASVVLPRVILRDDIRAELIRQARLDGVCHQAVDPQARAEFLVAVRNRILEENVDRALEVFPPPDLEYLCTLVSGIIGTGLPFHQDCGQFAFVSSFRDHSLARIMNVDVPLRNDEDHDDEDHDDEDHDDEEHDDEDPMAPGNEFDDIWEDWEIAVAFRIGVGIRGWGGSYALFCRNEGHKQWRWRYGVHDEDWYSDVYDSVEEFLEFYAHFKEEHPNQIKRYLLLPRS
ncbi:hypothetical protein LTR85_011787 [Meristemomyces frigidus]|nr:hypothetical protein LTR85_011787 [Meristemomyces frigidus]